MDEQCSSSSATSSMLTVGCCGPQGMSEALLNKLLAKHDREMHDLTEAQQEDKERQQERFQERLARKRRDWQQQQAEEEQEQEALRQHEDNVIRWPWHWPTFDTYFADGYHALSLYQNEEQSVWCFLLVYMHPS